MQDFEKLEQEAREHPRDVDEAVSAGKREAQQRLGGSDASEVDMAGSELEKELGATPPGQQPPQP